MFDKNTQPLTDDQLDLVNGGSAKWLLGKSYNPNDGAFITTVKVIDRVNPFSYIRSLFGGMRAGGDR